jgi:NADPH-dependent 2,4-dienoyl-CoA reductase/sulfur reductase-like enzyme
MAATLSVSSRGRSVVIVDREPFLGGILPQCIHAGFGLRRFGEELTGPEFSLRLERAVTAANIPFRPLTTVLSLKRLEDGTLSLLLSSARDDVYRVITRSCVLATGSRERNRGNVRIAGSRPSGVFTAGLAQRLVNVDGYLPGKEAVIIGSGDIGLIMARRLVLSGMTVKAVVEIQANPSGLARNVAQCLDDFSIPLYLSYATLRVIGTDRVTGVEVAPLAGGAVLGDKAFIIPCDTVLLSVGLVPENELASTAGIALDGATGGPVTDSRFMTNLPGVFVAGNALHIHDLVDNVVEEAELAGASCADWLDSADAACGLPGEAEALSNCAELPLRAGKNVRYTVPSSLDPSRASRFSFRSMIPIDRATLSLSSGSTVLWSKKLSWVRPGEMLTVELPALGNVGGAGGADQIVDVSLVDATEGNA